MIDYLDYIKPLEDDGKSDAEILAALNAKTIERKDSAPKTGVQVKDALGSATAAGAAIATLESIADGTAELPEGVPDEVRGVVRMELAQLAGAGLDLSNPGTNDFLRLIGLSNVAELGIWHESTFEVATSNRGATMVQEDLAASRESFAQQSAHEWINAQVRTWVDAIDAGETDKDVLAGLIDG